MRRLYFTILFFSFGVFCFADAAIERRAAIDIGSGGTKIAIADVDTENDQILEVIYDTTIQIPYQASLDKATDGCFDEDTREMGLAAFHDIKAVLDSQGVEKVAAIATSAFRKAKNGKEFVELVKEETGINIRVITQKEEGEIAYFSAVATGEFDPSDAVVWDIGTGSLQMTTKTESGTLSVYMGENMGSVEFKTYIINTIQDRFSGETNSPNPISSDELTEADRYARAFGRKAFPIIKEKIKKNSTVIGIGRLFYHSIRPVAAEDGVITRKGLRRFIRASLEKTDEELNNPYAHVDVSNSILTLAIMKALHVQAIKPVDTTTTRGMLIYPEFWKE